MKQRSKLLCGLLCLALCLCMVLVALPATKAFAACEHVDANKKDGRCDTCGSLMQDVYLAYTTASLEDKISVNYFLLLSDAVANDANAYIQFTMADDEVIQIPATESKLIDGYDVFTCEVAAKEMTDIITMQFYYNGRPAFEKDHQYTVRTYAKHIMDNYQDAKTLDLMEKMVNYGAASQIHFSYKADDLANNFLANKPDYSQVTITGFDSRGVQGTERVKLYSASLLLTSETTLRLFFNGQVSVTLEGKPLQVKYRSGLYYADIVGIAAKDLDKDVTVVINDGTETASITYNPMTYCQAIQNSAAGTYTDKMQNLVRALYLYNQSADDYFASHVTQGTNMVNALHYLNGDTTKTKITTNVKNVTFGYSRDYRNVANNYPATLISEEQETPVYAYYVPNGSNYDVYVLSNETIYAPTISDLLFKGMSNLTAVYTKNFDTSRAVSMKQLFRECAKLTTVDLTGWDTSKVTNMAQMFYKCTVLETIPGLGKLDTGAVKNMSAMFRECGITSDLNLTGWDVSSATSMEQMFYKCLNLENLNAEGWNAGACTIMKWMFAKNPKLETVNAAGWDTSAVTNMYAMFNENTALKTLDVTGWDTSNVTDIYGMFTRCSALETIIGSGDLDFGKVTNMSSVFEGMGALTYLDVTSWDCGSVTNMTQMFAWCPKLQIIEGTENWDTSNVTSMQAMFYACYDLREINVTGWDVSKVTGLRDMFSSENQNAADMKLEKVIGTETWRPTNVTHIGSMFYGCGQLTELNLSGWDMPKMENANHMFADCHKLESINLTGWNTPNVFTIDCMFNHCMSLKTIDVSSFTTDKVVEFSQLFEGCGSLTEIIGLENFNTAKGASFSEMFSGCGSLKVLDLSSFDTRSADENYKYHYTHVTDYSEGFEKMFTGLTSLEKLVLGENFSFDGDGKVTNESYKAVIPTPSKVERWNGHWYDETGKAYKPSEIPEKTAHTYVAYYTPQGTTMKNALTYLNADPASTGITTKVTSVTFGLTKDHAEIANTYTGVLADQEQDAPVYAYYVPNGSNYAVYLLSDSVIYLPKDATKLFNGMTNLTTLNVQNLSTARTTTFKGLFQNCNKLQTLDVSKWDTSNVNDFIAAFNQCNSLTLVGYENWNTSKVTNMSMLFQGNRAITQMDLSGWDMSAVTTVNAMFNGCTAMTNLDTTGWKLNRVADFYCAFSDCKELIKIDGIAGWELGSATTLDHLFYNCLKLQNPDISNWNVSTVTNFKYMMAHAKSITELDLSNWDVSKGTIMNHMFYNCTSLETLKADNWNPCKSTTFNHMFASATQNGSNMKLKTVVGIENWNTGSVTQLYSMFYGCGSLTSMDLSNWDVSKVISISHMFADCSNLVSVNLKGWDTSSLVSLDCTFNHCGALKTLDVSTFKTHNVKEFSQAFEACTSLESIDGLENWDTSSACSFEEMFSGCTSLKALDLSSFDTRNARDSYKAYHGDTYSAFKLMFNGVTSLEELTLGANFCFTGNGTAAAVTLPNPASINGQATQWYNPVTDAYYDASTLPELTAGTYVASLPRGATMKNALHYLNGNTSSTKITNNVASVTFGLNEKYPEVVNNNTGTLMNVEQNTSVYVYYLENNGKYDLYFLADDDIYFPKDCTGLFAKMGALVSVNTDNLNTSRASNMTDLFYKCPKLASIDPSNWDTRNFTNLYGIFGECPSLTELDVSGWNTSSLESTHDTFVNSTGLVTIKGLENWDTSNVTNMVSMFNGCTSLVDVGDISGWDTSKVESMRYMFHNCRSLAELDIADWDTGNVTEMHFMFKGCRELTYLDLSGWDTGKVTTFNSMFSSFESHIPDMKLKTVNGIEDWDTSSAETMGWMFYGCGAIEELDLSKWDVSKVTSMYHIFADCVSLTKVNFTGWNTASIQDMNGMFNDCNALQVVDVSEFDTATLTDVGQMFEGCDQLVEIIGMDRWDVRNVKNTQQMFQNSNKLKSLDLSGFVTSSLTDTRYMFQSCTALETIYVGDGWDMSKVTESDSMFLNCTSLVGGNGTTFQGSDLKYACVDTQETPGYLTYKATET